MKNILTKAAVAFSGVIAGVMLMSASASAIPYTGSTTVASPVPAFNVFTPTASNPLPAPAPDGGESNFYEARVPANGDLNDATTQYSDPVNTSCTNGKIVQLHIYVHNGASADNNDNGSGPSVAHGVKVKVALPTTTANSFKSTATISASNAATVSDGLTINCGNGETASLQYITGSASQYSNGSGVLPLSDSIVSSGVPIQSEKTPGDVWGCWNERVYVVLAVKIVVKPVVTPPVATAMCTLFTVSAAEDRTVKVANYTQNVSNATFKSMTIDWSDGSTSVITDQSKVIGTSHQYTKDGNYKVAATVTYTSTVDGSTITSLPADSNCFEAVSFNTKTPPVVTPPSTPTPPATLVNTGAGSTIGIFAAASAIGTLAYRKFLSRRLSN